MSSSGIRRGLLHIVSAAALSCAPFVAASPAVAQNAGTSPGATPAGAGKKAAAPALEIPEALLQKIIAGDPEALKAIRDFLVGTDRRPEAITRRATQLITQLGKMKTDAKSAAALLKVVDHVASSAINMVSGAQIIRIGIDKNYVPSKAVLAWSFGTPDSKAPAGFDKVLPGDPRIAGAKLDALRRPSDNDLLNGGISGIERIETNMPDGKYRIILLTQNLGDRKMMSNPFGSEVVVNGSALPVNQPDDDEWVNNAVLTNRGTGVLDASTGGGAAGATTDGFLSGNLSANDNALSQSQQGGAIIVPVTVRNGKLVVELKGLGNARSYLTGMMVEPAKDTSDLVMSHEALSTVAPPEMRLALEENILTAAANVLANLAPAAGNPALVDLPAPILNPQENASVSG